MSDETKVTLSPGELAMAQDPEIILTKTAVIRKAALLFGNMVPGINACFAETLSHDPAIIASVPKISKGENYKGFPYVLLDHPAVFGKENIFALRTMFWWGHFFSITLQLSGKYKSRFQNIIFKNLTGDFFIACGEDEWQHHFGEDNFIPFASIPENKKATLSEKHFLKIALRFEVGDWNEMQALLQEGYEKINNAIT